MGKLSSRVAIITGGTRGFGLEIARLFGHEGACLVVASRSDEAVGRAVTLLTSAGAKAAGMACDVSDLGQVRALVDLAYRSFGGFDIWINNAGIAGTYGPTMHISPDEMTRIVQTNILGTYYGSRVAMEHFLPRGSGKLINITGRGARGPVPYQNAYASSKAWIKSFTLALADEYRGRGVGIYLLSPGMMITEMVTDVEVVEGYEERLRALPTVLRILASRPDVPAARALWIAAEAKADVDHPDVRVMGPGKMLAGVLGEGVRRLLRRPAPELAVAVRTVPPDIDSRSGGGA